MGVKFIKIPKVDKNGKNFANTLESLTQIVIPSASAYQKYNIIGGSDKGSYYLYSVTPLNTDYGTWDIATAAYNLTNTFDGTYATIYQNSISQPMPLKQENNFTNTSTENALVEKSFTNQFGQTFYAPLINTMPISGKALNIDVSFDAAFSAVMTLKFYVLQSNEFPNGLNSGSFDILYESAAVSGPTQNISATITRQPQYQIVEGKYIWVAVVRTNGAPNGVTISNSSLSITSTAASGPDTDTYLNPYLTSKFIGSDYEVLLNNVDTYPENKFLQDLDYGSSTTIAVNYEAILSGSAVKGTVPRSNYTSKASTIPRYIGSKIQSSRLNEFTGNIIAKEDSRTLQDSPVNGIQSPISLVQLNTLTDPAFFNANFNTDPSYTNGVLSKKTTQINASITYQVSGVKINLNEFKEATKNASSFGIEIICRGEFRTDGSTGDPQRMGLSLQSEESYNNNEVSLGRIIGSTDTVTDSTSWQAFDFSGTLDTDTLLSKLIANEDIISIAFFPIVPGAVGMNPNNVFFQNVAFQMKFISSPVNIGTYGKTPSIDSLHNVLYEFEWGGGTTPEILDWGALKLKQLLQVDGPDAVKQIDPSANIVTTVDKTDFYLSNTSIQRARTVVNDPNGNVFPPESIPTASTILPGSSFVYNYYLQSSSINDVKLTLDSNNPTGTEISLFTYPSINGEQGTFPVNTKILDTTFGIPAQSAYAMTSSNPQVYGELHLSGQSSETDKIISFDRSVSISRVTKDSNGYYNGGPSIKPNYQTIGNEINLGLNNGERWFITLYNEFEFPNGEGDYNTPLISGSLTPYNQGYENVNSSPLHYKGVWEIIGTNDLFSNSTWIIYLKDSIYKLPGFATTYIGGATAGNSLGALIWKAKSPNKSEFVLVQDLLSRVGPGAFTNRYAPKTIIDNFNQITRTYGSNTTG